MPPISPKDFKSRDDDISSRIFETLGNDIWFQPSHGDDSTLIERSKWRRSHSTQWNEKWLTAYNEHTNIAEDSLRIRD